METQADPLSLAEPDNPPEEQTIMSQGDTRPQGGGGKALMLQGPIMRGTGPCPSWYQGPTIPLLDRLSPTLALKPLRGRAPPTPANLAATPSRRRIPGTPFQVKVVDEALVHERGGIGADMVEGEDAVAAQIPLHYHAAVQHAEVSTAQVVEIMDEMIEGEDAVAAVRDSKFNLELAQLNEFLDKCSRKPPPGGSVPAMPPLVGASPPQAAAPALWVFNNWLQPGEVEEEEVEVKDGCKCCKQSVPEHGQKLCESCGKGEWKAGHKYVECCKCKVQMLKGSVFRKHYPHCRGTYFVPVQGPHAVVVLADRGRKCGSCGNFCPDTYFPVGSNGPCLKHQKGKKRDAAAMAAEAVRAAMDVIPMPLPTLNNTEVEEHKLEGLVGELRRIMKREQQLAQETARVQREKLQKLEQLVQVMEEQREEIPASIQQLLDGMRQ